MNYYTLTLRLIFCSLISFCSSAQFKNVVIAEDDGQGYPPVEPSISINPKNPKNIVAGIVLDRVRYSMDGGKTWEKQTLTSDYGVFGDPAVIADPKGNFYYFHLANPDNQRGSERWLEMMVCHKSTDGGKTWNNGVAIGQNPPKDQDKEWPAVHPKNDFMTLTWTQFDKYGSEEESCHSNILISLSHNGGKKWSTPVTLSQKPGDCVDDDSTTEGATSAINQDGKIFVVWANEGKLYMDRSYDKGKTWLENDMVIGQQAGGWTLDIPGMNRCNGMPILQVDNSNSRYKNRLYVVWADQKFGKDNTDIWIMSSQNGGDYWTSPKRVNQDNTSKHQFLPWLSVDPKTGALYVLYYDRRAYDDLQTDVYVAVSNDGGLNFKEYKISEKPFTPTSEKFFGDYTNISAYNNTVAAIWARMDEGKSSIVTTVFNATELK